MQVTHSITSHPSLSSGTWPLFQSVGVGGGESRQDSESQYGTSEMQIFGRGEWQTSRQITNFDSTET